VVIWIKAAAQVAICSLHRVRTTYQFLLPRPMQLIRNVRIRGFRSIQSGDLNELGQLTALVGKNSSGKSNVLRALNLFFNGTVDGQSPVNFTRDHHDEPVKRRKKEIAVEVDFDLPTTFRPRKELAGISTWGNSFTIRKLWELDQRRNPVEVLSVTAGGMTIPNAEELARQFLALFTYRYVPNRSIPAQFLKDESQAIADSIFMRMKGDKHAAALFKSFGAAATRMLSSVSQALEETGSPLKSPSLVTAESIGEMLSMRGFQAVGPHGGPVQDEDWGSGHQAFFLYLILHLIDTNYARFWGWKQGTIWGLEEPESGLHRDLETRLADQIRSWALDERSRLQVIQTTHSPVFTMASDCGYWIALDDSKSVFQKEANPALIRLAEIEGVSGWTHPALSFPWNPVVLVEGHYDVEALYHAAKLSGNEDLRFVRLPGLDPDETAAGKDQITTYLKKISSLIPNRPAGAPLIALFDWDVSEQELKKARSAYGTDGATRVLRMDPAHADVRLGEDFTGIERFYPPSIVEDGHNAGEFAVAMPSSGPFSISKPQLKKAKGRLSTRLKTITSPTDLAPLIKVLADVRRAI
jgi:hypothetical protein